MTACDADRGGIDGRVRATPLCFGEAQEGFLPADVMKTGENAICDYVWLALGSPRQ